ncbi:hypothetical protein ACTWQB_12200 [Piscibacillus sp. B03]|uniref:hypothetical protein n=1 Tax=Piscibacillus sp. B03 TaxID=3457430 RepID=UPI003FCEC873
MIKKITTILLISLGALLLSTVNVAAEEHEEIGGWSEDTGYYSNEDESSKDFSIQSATHKGWVTYRGGDNTRIEKAAVGETTWAATHFTRAWLQERNGSARKGQHTVYGSGYTKAQSGWGIHHTYSPDPYVARTGYGSWDAPGPIPSSNEDK